MDEVERDVATLQAVTAQAESSVGSLKCRVDALGKPLTWVIEGSDNLEVLYQEHLIQEGAADGRR